MIWLVMDRPFAHGGMTVYAEQLVSVSDGLVTAVDDRRLEELRPGPGDVVLFNEDLGRERGAWLARLAVDRPRGVRTGLLLHSTLAQMDLSNELEEVLGLIGDTRPGRKLDVIVVADEDLAAVLRAALPGRRSLWLPHALPQRAGPSAPPTPVQGRLFLPLTADDRAPFYRHKNTYAQVAAVAMAQAETAAELTVVVSYASPLLLKAAAALGVNIIAQGSLPQPDYERFLQTVQIGLAASFAESFSYAAADMMAAGVPVLFGPTVRWAWRDSALRDAAGVTDPGDARSLSGRLASLLTDPSRYAAAAAAARRVVGETAQRNREKLAQALRRLCAGEEQP